MYDTKTTFLNMIAVILTIIVISNKKEVTDTFNQVIVEYILKKEIDNFLTTLILIKHSNNIKSIIEYELVTLGTKTVLIKFNKQIESL